MVVGHGNRQGRRGDGPIHRCHGELLFHLLETSRAHAMSKRSIRAKHDIVLDLAPAADLILNFFAITTNRQQPCQRFAVGELLLHLRHGCRALPVGTMFVNSHLDSRAQFACLVRLENVAIWFGDLGPFEDRPLAVARDIYDRQVQFPELSGSLDAIDFAR